MFDQRVPVLSTERDRERVESLSNMRARDTDGFAAAGPDRREASSVAVTGIPQHLPLPRYPGDVTV